jgi:hypothetical protein
MLIEVRKHREFRLELRTIFNNNIYDLHVDLY